ncbi:MAG: cell division protein FtsX [Xanthobacteraceae bacterium]
MADSGIADDPERPYIDRRRGTGGARPDTPIVPKNTIAGRALTAVVAIMTFLATLTTGAVVLVVASASEWQSDVAREMTIQVRPRAGRDIDRDVARAAEIARATAGVVEVRPYSRAESARLLEPWLGNMLALDDLPVPRLIVVKLSSAGRLDPTALRDALAREIPAASLDDHRGWIERMRAMAGSAIATGLLIVALMMAATILSVTFATRGAMAANRPILEVLHFIGATDRYIATQFQHHFLTLGLKGAALGGGVALLLFALARLMTDRFVGTASGDEINALFGSFALGATGYVLICLQAIAIAAVTALTSRNVVASTLREII